ncbi:hypothetical protein RBSWK_01239 [Rhodopirellula baltica SWK14]|nr:hypothetical protein RBSWK_01239 [Rhodopirellula baltica SWK14]
MVKHQRFFCSVFRRSSLSPTPQQRIQVRVNIGGDQRKGHHTKESEERT